MRGVVQELIKACHAEYLMGTVVEISVWTLDHSGDEAIDRSMLEFKRLENMFSRFDECSELALINRQAATKDMPVSDEFFRVVSSALEYSARSGGCFSPGLSPLVQTWERAARNGCVPADTEIHKAQGLCNPDLVVLDRRRRSIRFLDRGVALDLGGFVKGYAVDRAREIIQSYGCERAFINAGRSSLASIIRSAGALHRVGILHPENRARLVGSLLLDNQCLSTSGTREQFFEIDGRTFSHVIDPRTGMPVQGVKSATAVCASAARAEVISKMLLLDGCSEATVRCDLNGWSLDSLTVVSEGGPEVYIEHSSSLQFTSPGDAVERTSRDQWELAG
ncbi:MAG TPA: FAD:protein FMN transferase [Blastocatellia bacterium]|nr:FAD:protein FMN transferase [Blastocatellia bacterium]